MPAFSNAQIAKADLIVFNGKIIKNSYTRITRTIVPIPDGAYKLIKLDWDGSEIGRKEESEATEDFKGGGTSR